MPRSRRAEAVLIGVLAGTFSGLTGVGGGAVMAPLLTGRIGLSQHRAHGTSLAIIMFVAFAGVLLLAQGNIDWRLVLALLPGALVGVCVGAMVKVPALQLRQGTVDLGVAPWIAPTAVLAALTANRIDAGVLKRTYGVTALLLGTETMYTSGRMRRAEPVGQR